MIIVAEKTGRLANRLILASNVIAVGIERKHRVLNPSFDEYAQYYNGTVDNLLCSFPQKKSLIKPDQLLRHKAYHGIAEIAKRTPNCIHHPEWPPLDLANHPLNAVTCIRGYYFRSPDLVQKHASRIKQYFTPVHEITSSAENVVASARQSSDTVVGVHIRQGDFSTWRDGAHYRPISAYAAVMHKIAEILSPQQTAFIVCSDESIDFDAFGGSDVLPGPGSVVGDNYALSLCDYIINTTGSTYAQWASWYGCVPLLSISTETTVQSMNDFNICTVLPD